MPLSFYTSRFSPESFELFLCNWQVFWLKVYFNAFPLYKKTVAKIEASRTSPDFFGRFGEAFYSYGDSSGFEPDSHFNPVLIIIRTETNYAANVKAIKYEFKNDLCTMLYNYINANKIAFIRQQ